MSSPPRPPAPPTAPRGAVRGAITRYPLAALGALLGTYGWVVVALFLAFFGAMFGAGAGLITGFSLFQYTGFGTLAVLWLTGAVTGGLAGFAGTYGVLLQSPLLFFLNLLWGALFALAWTWISYRFEFQLHRLRGYRRMSRDEAQHLMPWATEVARRLGYDKPPLIAIHDHPVPGAHAYTRSVVLTTGLLTTLDGGQLGAVLAHELGHIRRGDTLGLTFVWACALPLVTLYNLITAGGKYWRLLGLVIGWPVAGTVWALIIAPLMRESRRNEYHADATAKGIGLADELGAALRAVVPIEPARTGWQRAVAATHPPTALRVEALQEPSRGEAAPSLPPRPPEWGQVPAALPLFGAALLIALIVLAVIVVRATNPLGFLTGSPSSATTPATPAAGAAPSTSVPTALPTSTGNVIQAHQTALVNAIRQEERSPNGATVSAAVYAEILPMGSTNWSQSYARDVVYLTTAPEAVASVTHAADQIPPPPGVWPYQTTTFGARSEKPASGEDQRFSIWIRTDYAPKAEQSAPASPSAVQWSTYTVGLKWDRSSNGWQVVNASARPGPTPAPSIGPGPPLPAGFASPPPNLP